MEFIDNGSNHPTPLLHDAQLHYWGERFLSLGLGLDGVQFEDYLLAPEQYEQRCQRLHSRREVDAMLDQLEDISERLVGKHAQLGHNGFIERLHHHNYKMVRKPEARHAAR